MSYYRNLRFTKKGRWATYPADAELWHTDHTSRYFEDHFGLWREILAVCIVGKEKEEEQHMYVPESFVEKLHARIQELTAQDPKGMEKLFIPFYASKEAAKREIPQINPPDLSKVSGGELADIYLENRDQAHRIVIYDQFTWLAEDYWPPLMDEVLVGKMKLTKDSEEYNTVLFALIKPREISTTLEEKRELIEETLKIQQGARTVEVAAERLAHDFGWMPVLAFGVPWNAERYESELKDTLTRETSALERELAELKNYTQIRDRDIVGIVKKYDISPEDLQVFVDFGLAIDTRNEAEYVASVAGFYLLPIYDEMVKRFKISINELRTLLEDEMVACLRGEADPRAVLKSKGRIIAWGLDGEKKERVNFSPGEGEEVFTYVESQQKAGKAQATYLTRGITANKGKARGKA
ncbi:MAG: hypothetical protein AAB538_04185, partial [Patescibacteria group bacterium]